MTQAESVEVSGASVEGATEHIYTSSRRPSSLRAQAGELLRLATAIEALEEARRAHQGAHDLCGIGCGRLEQFDEARDSLLLPADQFGSCKYVYSVRSLGAPGGSSRHDDFAVELVASLDVRNEDYDNDWRTFRHLRELEEHPATVIARLGAVEPLEG